jgi:hypothetical protein
LQLNGKAFGRLPVARKSRYNLGAMVDGSDEQEPDEDNGQLRSAPKSPAKLRGWKKWLQIGIALFITVGGFASFASLYQEVRAGRGGELYRSMWGYKVSPIGILVAAGTSVVALFAIWAIQWGLHRRDQAWRPKRPRKPT